MTNYVETISSTATGLYKARETVPGEVPVNAKWFEKEPNEYGDFGPDLKTVARSPINADRRQKKGTIVGFSAKGSYTTDLTAANLTEDIEEFCFSAARRKAEISGVATITNTGFTVASGGAAYVQGTLLAAKGAALPSNNGLKVAGAGSDATHVNVTGLTPASGQNITLSRVGVEFTAGDVKIDVTGPLPALTSTVFDFTTLGFIPGEIVYIGGDGVGTSFAAPVNKGFARVKTVAAHAIIFDKTDATFVVDPGTGKTIRLFFGRVVRDENSDLQVAYTSCLRRLLGRPDRDNPDKVQSEVLTRAVANKLVLTIPEEDKITANLEYICGDHLTSNDDETDFGGDFVAVEEADAINSTSDSVRAQMIVYPKDGNDASPAPLFAVFQELDLTIDNKVQEKKAVTRMGSFASVPGIFTVTGSFKGYFVTVDAVKAVRNNADVSFLFATFKANRGIAIDIPMISLSTSGLDLAPNDSVTIPLDAAAATGKKYDPNMPHTVLFVFFDYLPNAAAN